MPAWKPNNPFRTSSGKLKALLVLIALLGLQAFSPSVAILPYAAQASTRPDRPSGLTRSDLRSSPGINLMCLGSQGVFLDAQGQVDRRLPDLADVLVPTRAGGSWLSFVSHPGPEYTHQLTCVDASGKRLWTTPGKTYHHSIDVDDQGRIVTLSARVRSTDPIPTYEELGVVVFSPSGQQLKQWSVRDLFGPVPKDARVKLNSVRFLLRDHPVLGRKGDVLVAAPEGLGGVTFVVFDPATGAVRWKSRPQMEYSHDAHVLDNGHILALDNGKKRGWSRAIEIDPATNRVVWEYKQPATFGSTWGGSVQRLRNGNTLIAETDKGRAFEITPGGEIVWEWLTPIVSEVAVADAVEPNLGSQVSARITPVNAYVRNNMFWIRRLEH